MSVTPPSRAGAVAGAGTMRFLTGPEQGLRVAVQAGTEVTLGRGEEADVRLLDDEISRRHTVLAFDGAAWWVTDCGSKNGTYLDRVRLTAEERTHWPMASVVVLGSSRLVLEPLNAGGSSVGVATETAAGSRHRVDDRNDDSVEPKGKEAALRRMQSVARGGARDTERDAEAQLAQVEPQRQWRGESGSIHGGLQSGRSVRSRARPWMLWMLLWVVLGFGAAATALAWVWLG